MKRIIVLIVTIIMVFTLGGCLKLPSSVRYDSDDKSEDLALRETLEKVVEAINNKDESAIKALISKASIDFELEQGADIDQEIKALIEIFGGQTIIFDSIDLNTTKQADQEYDGGLKRAWVQSKYMITTEDNSEYQLILGVCYEDVENKDEIGIFALSVIKGNIEDTPDEFTWGGNTVEAFSFDEAVVTNMAQSIVDAINNTDAEAIKALLSENAKEYIFDVDTDIQWLFDAFYGKKIVSIDELSFVAENTYANRHDVEVSNRWSRIYVLTLEDGTEYEMKISMYSMDKEDPGNVGLNIISVIKCRMDTLESEDRMMWESYLSNPKINVYKY